MSVNSSVSLIHGQHLRCHKVLFKLGTRLAGNVTKHFFEFSPFIKDTATLKKPNNFKESKEDLQGNGAQRIAFFFSPLSLQLRNIHHK